MRIGDYFHLKGSYFIIGVTITFFLLSVGYLFNVFNRDYLLLSDAFAQGKVYLGTATSRWDFHAITENNLYNTFNTDYSIYRGKVYYPLGPLPAVFFLPLLPFIYLLKLWDIQAVIHFFFTLINFWLLVSIGRNHRLTINQSLWLAFAFIFASSYIGVAFFGLSSYFSHIVTTTWILASIKEYFERRRYWFIGILMGFALATRVTAGLGIIFFILNIFFESGIKISGTGAMRVKMSRVLQLLIPFFIIIGILMSYNYIRFGTFSENGYRYSQIEGTLKDVRDTYGVLSTGHISQNLYYSLLSVPRLLTERDGSLSFPFVKSEARGMSLLLVCPYLLALFFSDLKNRMNQQLLITAFVIFLSLMFLFSTGSDQFGYRFSLDFLPYLHLILLTSIASKKLRLTESFKFIIMISGLLNLYFVLFTAFLRVHL